MKTLVELHDEMRACRRCVAAGHAITPGAIFHGRATAQVMLIGQAPGVTEVTAQRPFNAGSGRRLFQWLNQAGWDEAEFRATQYMTAVTKCYPGKDKSGRGDRVPSPAEQALCRPFLAQEIALVRPRLMILVGGLAIKLLYPPQARLDEVIGTAVYFPPAALANPVNFDLAQGVWLTEYDPQRDGNGRWVVPLPHPSGASLWPNKPANQALIARALALLNAIRLVHLDWFNLRRLNQS
jgi:uracil-DNA glycosylase